MSPLICGFFSINTIGTLHLWIWHSLIENYFCISNLVFLTVDFQLETKNTVLDLRLVESGCKGLTVGSQVIRVFSTHKGQCPGPLALFGGQRQLLLERGKESGVQKKDCPSPKPVMSVFQTSDTTLGPCTLLG